MKKIQSYEFPIDIDNLPLHIAIYRYEKGGFVFVGFNRMAEKIEGVRREDLLGKKLRDVFPDVKKSGLYDLLLKVWRTHENDRLDIAFSEGERDSGWCKNEVVYLPNGDVMAMRRDVSSENHFAEARTHRLMNLIDKSQMVIFHVQNQSRWPVEFVSNNVEQWGYSKADFESGKLTFIDLVHPEDTAEIEAVTRDSVKRNGLQCTQVYRILTADGQERWVDDRTVVERNDEGKVCRYLCSMVDITELQNSQERLKLLSQVVEQTEDLIRITDKEGIITYANPAFYTFTGFEPDEVVGKPSNIIKSNQLDDAFYEHLWATINSGKSFKATFVNQKKNQQIFYEQETITPILNADQKILYFVATGKDITARVMTEQENELLARTDKLTGIANRHKGDEFLEESMLQAQRYGQPLSVILFDIDFFKAVNDEYGHPAGDDVLVTLCELVKQEVRQTDLLVRWGGEEFVLITPQTNLAHAEELAEKIRLSVQKAKFGEVKQLTVSCGVTDRKGQETAQELMVRVDEVLYEAKKTGRNKVVIR